MHITGMHTPRPLLPPWLRQLYMIDSEVRVAHGLDHQLPPRPGENRGGFKLATRRLHGAAGVWMPEPCAQSAPCKRRIVITRALTPGGGTCSGSIQRRWQCRLLLDQRSQVIAAAAALGACASLRLLDCLTASSGRGQQAGARDGPISLLERAHIKTPTGFIY